MRINVCFASDNNYAQHLGVTIASILKNAKKSDELYFYILGAINEVNKSRINSLKNIKDFSIEFIPIDEKAFEQCPLMGNHITIATYFRFMIPSLLPNLDKVLYLDCDMVINCSLSELFDENVDDYWIAGVEDLGYFEDRRKLNRETQSFYINAGLILINAKKWREDDIQEKLFDFAVNSTDILVHQDQDVINMVLNKKSKPLDVKWNVQDSFYRCGSREFHPQAEKFKWASKKPAIIHYTGKVKPWDDYLTLQNSDLYLKYLRCTEWKNVLPSESQINKMFLEASIKYWFKNPFFFMQKDFWKINSLDKKKMLFS